MWFTDVFLIGVRQTMELCVLEEIVIWGLLEDNKTNIEYHQT